MASAPLLREDHTLHAVGRQSGTHTLTMGLQLTQFPRKMDANGKAAGWVGGSEGV